MALKTIKAFNDVDKEFNPDNTVDKSKDNLIFEGAKVEEYYTQALKYVSSFLGHLNDLNVKFTSFSSSTGLTGDNITNEISAYKNKIDKIRNFINDAQEDFKIKVTARLEAMDEGEKRAYRLLTMHDYGEKVVEEKEVVDETMIEAQELEKWVLMQLGEDVSNMDIPKKETEPVLPSSVNDQIKIAEEKNNELAEKQKKPEIKTNVELNENSKTIDIPSSVRQSGISKNMTPYDKFYGRWNNNTGQKALSELWNSSGRPSDRNIATYDGRYLVAVSQKFGKVGDQVDIVLSDNTVIPCIIADAKGADAQSEWGHEMGSGGVDIIEWQQANSITQRSDVELGDWVKKSVTKVINQSNNILE